MQVGLLLCGVFALSIIEFIAGALQAAPPAADGTRAHRGYRCLLLPIAVKRSLPPHSHPPTKDDVAPPQRVLITTVSRETLLGFGGRCAQANERTGAVRISSSDEGVRDPILPEHTVSPIKPSDLSSYISLDIHHVVEIMTY
ncbi:uncharacterized [Tachysurus ichikawai]